MAQLKRVQNTRVERNSNEKQEGNNELRKNHTKGYRKGYVIRVLHFGSAMDNIYLIIMMETEVETPSGPIDNPDTSASELSIISRNWKVGPSCTFQVARLLWWRLTMGLFSQGCCEEVWDILCLP